MKYPRHVIRLIVIFAVAYLIYSLLNGSDSESDKYDEVILKERLEKDNFLKTSAESPFGDNKKDAHPLSYFPPDRKFIITADLKPIDNKKVVVLPTSSGEEEKYLEYGWAEFKLDGISNRLLLLEVMASGPTRGTLFLAFADETSANETYGGGRYLELKKIPSASTISLDFNKAYNPYCAYAENFSCPMPPRENVLKVAIRAGEKNYSK